MYSNRTGLIFLVAVFVLGAILFAFGTLLARRERIARTSVAPSVSQEEQLDMIERLVMVGQPWCVDELRGIVKNDADPTVRDAADAALLVIGSRRSLRE